MKKTILVMLLSVFLLTGCDESENEHINVEGKTVNSTDDINIILNKNWWVKDYVVDYENKQVILNIEKERGE